MPAETRDLPCQSYLITGACRRGRLCPYRHLTGEKVVVCKHWLRGLCKKGDLCDFLHRFDMARMPVCYFFASTGECTNEECLFQHVNPSDKVFV